LKELRAVMLKELLKEFVKLRLLVIETCPPATAMSSASFNSTGSRLTDFCILLS
jgi:hypothetical protein